jgi:hypothetical protein
MCRSSGLWEGPGRLGRFPRSSSAGQTNGRSSRYRTRLRPQRTSRARPCGLYRSLGSGSRLRRDRSVEDPADSMHALWLSAWTRRLILSRTYLTLSLWRYLRTPPENLCPAVHRSRPLLETQKISLTMLTLIWAKFVGSTSNGVSMLVGGSMKVGSGVGPKGMSEFRMMGVRFWL